MYRRTLNAGELVVVVHAGSVFRHYSFRQKPPINADHWSQRVVLSRSYCVSRGVGKIIITQQ